MRAITFSQFGGPEVLEVSEVEVPSPGPGQIRVAVRAAGVNPFDWKVRRGLMGGDLPKRVGSEFAGVVDALGDDVNDVALGDEVFGFAVGGGAADYTLASAYAKIPTSLDFTAAAGLPVAVETAFRVLDAVGVAAGSTVLINGAAGGVGQAAVQVAVARGAHVIGTASEANFEFLRGLGAEPVLYGDGLVERVRALGVSSVDGAVDAAGHDALPALIELADGPDHVVTIADFDGAQQLGVTFSSGGGDERALYGLAEVGTLIAAGQFSLPVVATFPLEQVAEAHTLSEDGHVRGKLVLNV